jgi:hypothetical protein
LSFDSPYSDYRPYHIFFQNYFCSRLQIPIVYPFKHSFLPHYLEKTRYPISLLNKVADLLIQEKKCGEKFPKKRTNKIVFESSSEYSDLPSIPPSGSSTILSSLLFLNKNYSQLELLNFNELSSNSLNYIHKLAHIVSPLLNTPASSSQDQHHNQKTEKKEIILLLVTLSYEELFLNFLCHLEKITSSFSLSTLFLVITPHDRIADIALKHHKPFFKVTSKDIRSLFPYLPTFQIQRMLSSTGSDFGEILYQQLIFLRSVTAFYLLKYFHASVVIADIDTIWLNNPLLFLPNLNHNFYPTEENKQQQDQQPEQQSEFDLRVTYDGENEICGCYLYLYPTANTLFFWSDVISRHSVLIQESYEHRKNDNEIQSTEKVGTAAEKERENREEKDDSMINLFDSEQKILSKIILQERNSYPVSLQIFFHDKRSFPNGRDYFVTGIASKSSSPSALSSASEVSSSGSGRSSEGQEQPALAIIHNNFIIGTFSKKIRFQRHNLWHVLYDEEHQHDFICINDPIDSLSFWMKSLSLSSASRDIIPSLNLISPIDNEILKTTRMALMLMMERDTNLPPPSSFSSSASSSSPSTLSPDLMNGNVWVSRSPNLSLVTYRFGFLVAELLIRDKDSFHFSIITEDKHSPNINVIADIGINANDNHNKASAQSKLLPFNQVGELEESLTQYFTTLSSQETLRLEEYQRMSPEAEEDRAEECPVNFDFHSKYFFSIKVLTYHRVQSLERLLESLLSVHYGQNMSVELCIHVDYPDQHTSVEQVSSLPSP